MKGIPLLLLAAVPAAVIGGLFLLSNRRVVRTGEAETPVGDPGRERRDFPETEFSPAAYLRSAPEPPGLTSKEVETYREARESILVHPEEFQTWLGAFVSDAATWKKPMRHMAESDPHPRARIFAVRVLSAMRVDGLDGFLRSRLPEENEAVVRRVLVETLETLPRLSSDTLELLRRLAAEDPDEETRSHSREVAERHAQD